MHSAVQPLQRWGVLPFFSIAVCWDTNEETKFCMTVVYKDSDNPDYNDNSFEYNLTDVNAFVKPEYTYYTSHCMPIPLRIPRRLPHCAPEERVRRLRGPRVVRLRESVKAPERRCHEQHTEGEQGRRNQYCCSNSGDPPVPVCAEQGAEESGCPRFLPSPHHEGIPCDSSEPGFLYEVGCVYVRS